MTDLLRPDGQPITDEMTPKAHDDVASAVIFDCTSQDFQEKVLEASKDKLILVQLHAAWCGPCKQLSPLVQEAVQKIGDPVQLARIDIDANPEIASAFRVQSVPVVFAIFQGQPVDAFQGVIPASEIKSFIEKQLEKFSLKPADNQSEMMLEQAEAALNAHKIDEARQLYNAILDQDEANADALAGLAQCVYAEAGREQALTFIEALSDKVKQSEAIKSLTISWHLEETAADLEPQDKLLQKIEKNNQDWQARFELSLVLFQKGEHEAAVDEIFTILKHKKDWQDDKARRQLLQYFEWLGHDHPLTMQKRRALSSLLFA